MNKPNDIFLTPARIALTVAVFASCTAVAEPDTKLDAAAVSALKSFSYADWTDVLAKHVDDQGRVDYAQLKAARAPLDRFVSLLGQAGPKTRPQWFPTKEHRLAYYVNAYNALTMFNVLNRLPALKSVDDEKVSFFVTTTFMLDGAPVSLQALENKMIRPTFQDPRVHFALNCASGGCPQLPRTPFLPDTLNAQLDRETQKFLHETRNVERKGERVLISSIFDWYKEDFGADPVAWIRRTAPDLAIPPGAAYDVRPYDWSLNAKAR
jgi:Protein of unknown function, DUF547